MKKIKLNLAAQIFIALVLAIVVGLLMGKHAAFANDYIKPFGTIFLNLLKFIVCPIVLFSILCGMISMKDIKKVGSIGIKTIVYYMLTTAVAIVIGLVMGVGAYLCAKPLLGIYLPDEPTAIPYGVTRLSFIGLPYVFCGLMEVFTGSQRGMGMSVTPMITSLVGSCLFRIVWIATVFSALRTLESLFVSYPISWILTSMTHMFFYFNYKRKHYPNSSAAVSQ